MTTEKFCQGKSRFVSGRGCGQSRTPETPRAARIAPRASLRCCLEGLGFAAPDPRWRLHPPGLLTVTLAAAPPLDQLERLRRLLSRDDAWGRHAHMRVTFCAGLTTWRPGEALREALARADTALYEAKATGRDRLVEK